MSKSQYNPQGITVPTSQTADPQCDVKGSIYVVAGGANSAVVTASALLKTGAGVLNSVTVSSHTGGTLKFWDQTTAAVPVLVDTITLAAGERYINFGGIRFSTGLYVTVGGTISCVVNFN
jgi:hypothetical protein